MCSKQECQSERRKRKQAEWRARNPEYFRVRSLAKRSREADAAEKAMGQPHKEVAGEYPRWPRPLRVPKVLRGVPWELAQSQIGVQVTDFMVVVALLMLKLMQSQRRLQAPENKEDTGRHDGEPVQSQRATVSG